MKQPSPITRLRVYMRDGFVCTYCGKVIKTAEDMTIDHVLPKNHGGTNQLSNLTSCCKRCNHDKKDLLLTQYLRAYEIKITPKIAKLL